MSRRIDWSGSAFRGVMNTLALLTLALLIAPTVVVVVVSFTNGFSLKFPPPGYSLRWYQELLDASQLHFAAWNSVKVALATTVLAVVLGVAGALAIARSQTASARVLDSLFMSPLVLPALAFGFAALMTFSAVGWTVSTTTLVIGHTVVCVPYVIRTTTAALAQMEPALLESSASLGASRLYTFRRVTLPLIRPGVMAKRSQIDSPRPPSCVAPSICGAEVAAPQRNPSGKRYVVTANRVGESDECQSKRGV